MLVGGVWVHVLVGVVMHASPWVSDGELPQQVSAVPAVVVQVVIQVVHPQSSGKVY